MSEEEKAGFSGRGNYSVLKHLRVEIDGEERAFFLCFWLYLVKSFAFPVTLLQKVVKAQPDDTGDSPFLIIDEKEVIFFQLHSLHKEPCKSYDSNSSLDVPSQSLDFECPLERWVHFGCEVSTNLIRLHIDGKIVGERVLPLVSEKDSISNSFSKITLVSGDGDKNEQGFIYNVEILPTTSSVIDHHAKDPPVQLSMDRSSAFEIEEVDGGIWSIVGGKVSCRRNFSLDVLLLDAFGQPVSSEMEVVASLVYLDNGEPVERTSDGEAPLLTSYDGTEIAASDRPSILFHGRASFKLKIAQLSSKCQSRLFRIMFHSPKMETCPFFEAFSPPIRSISRNKNTRVSSTPSKQATSTHHSLSQLSGLGEDMMEVGQNSLLRARSDLSSKRLRLEPPEEECNSHAWTENKEGTLQTSSTMRPENSAEDDSSSDSESTEVRNSDPKSTSSSGSSISDVTVFKYGLAGLTERSLILKEIANSASDEALLDFANQVSMYSGCSHHKSQIMMTKRLVEEGTKAWNTISQNNSRVLWQNIVFLIGERFTKISRCGSRSLSQQDFELLRRISGCQEYAARENFEQMWCWLYPVAISLSRDRINEMWNCMSPKWIEGFITKEEAESSLQGPRGVQEPGTFILRFPTSRSWPHPDAGSLVVTYVGRDYALHHKMLSLDRVFSSAMNDKDMKPLQDMLLQEPELLRLGRIIRSH